MLHSWKATIGGTTLMTGYTPGRRPSWWATLTEVCPVTANPHDRLCLWGGACGVWGATPQQAAQERPPNLRLGNPLLFSFLLFFSFLFFFFFLSLSLFFLPALKNKNNNVKIFFFLKDSFIRGFKRLKTRENRTIWGL